MIQHKDVTNGSCSAGAGNLEVEKLEPANLLLEHLSRCKGEGSNREKHYTFMSLKTFVTGTSSAKI